jgi:hypothetical protein
MGMLHGRMQACGVLIIYMLTLRHRCTEVNEIMRADTIMTSRAGAQPRPTRPGRAKTLSVLPRTKFGAWGSLHTADCGFYTLLCAGDDAGVTQQDSYAELEDAGCAAGKTRGHEQHGYVIQLPACILAPRQTRMIAGAGLASAGNAGSPGPNAATIREAPGSHIRPNLL